MSNDIVFALFVCGVGILMAIQMYFLNKKGE